MEISVCVQHSFAYYVHNLISYLRGFINDVARCGVDSLAFLLFAARGRLF